MKELVRSNSSSRSCAASLAARIASLMEPFITFEPCPILAMNCCQPAFTMSVTMTQRSPQTCVALVKASNPFFTRLTAASKAFTASDPTVNPPAICAPSPFIALPVFSPPDFTSRIRSSVFFSSSLYFAQTFGFASLWVLANACRHCFACFCS